MIDENIYGCDYSTSGEVSSNGDIMLVNGLVNAKQAISNQLLTRIGTYPSVDTEYGSNIFEYIGEDLSKSNFEALTVHINNALCKQERVSKVTRIQPYISIDRKVKVTIDVELVNGSEETINIELEE